MKENTRVRWAPKLELRTVDPIQGYVLSTEPEVTYLFIIIKCAGDHKNFLVGLHIMPPQQPWPECTIYVLVLPACTRGNGGTLCTAHTLNPKGIRREYPPDEIARSEVECGRMSSLRNLPCVHRREAQYQRPSTVRRTRGNVNPTLQT